MLDSNQIWKVPVAAVRQLPERNYRWNTNEEVLSILRSVQAGENQHWITEEKQFLTPVNGTLYVCARSRCVFRNDGYSWKRRRDGTAPREDHTRLKVNGVECISANYVHSDLVPTFHRRSYSLISSPEYILVHYLNVTSGEHGLVLRIIDNLRRHIVEDRVDVSQLLAQLLPMFSPASAQQPDCSALRPSLESMIEYASIPSECIGEAELRSIESTFVAFVQQNAGASSGGGYSPQKCSSDSDLRGALATPCSTASVQPTHGKLRSRHSLNNHDNSMYKAEPSTSGLGQVRPDSSTSGHSIMRSPAPPIGHQSHADSAYDSFGSSTQLPQISPMPDDSEVSRGNTLGLSEHEVNRTLDAHLHGIEHRHSVDIPDLYDLYHATSGREQPHSPRSDDGFVDLVAVSPTQQHRQRGHARAITDYSPEWSYTDGHTKVLVSGPWHITNPGYYSCRFDRTVYVEAVLVQPGVLKCLCPPHFPGKVQLEVATSDAGVISDAVPFEYRPLPHHSTPSSVVAALHSPQDWLSANDLTIASGLLSRLEQLCTQLDVPVDGTGEGSVGNTSCLMKSQLTRSQLHSGLQQHFVRMIRLMSARPWRMQAKTVAGEIQALHLAAALGYDAVIGALLEWSSTSPSVVLLLELDPLRRDCTGRTAFAWACARNHLPAALALLHHSRDALYCPIAPPSTNADRVLPLEDAFARGHYELVRTVVVHYMRTTQSQSLDTVLWVLMGGRITASALSAHVAPICVDSEVLFTRPLPDLVASPAVVQADGTAPERGDDAMEVDDGAREHMAQLAQQIIDALPAHIKKTSEPQSNSEQLFYHQQCAVASEEMRPRATLARGVSETSTGSVSSGPSSPVDQSDDGVPLNDWLAAAPDERCDVLEDIAPLMLESNFRQLKLTDREQRALYEAARIIQTAYRAHYKRRASQQADAQTTATAEGQAERHAAILIQSYYRRYKEYCYFKKLHGAAVLIQKHFRLYRQTKQQNLAVARATQAVADATEPTDELAVWKQHLAAIRIQHAFRGHYNRRHAAAKKIQKFMRRSHQILQKERV